MIATAPHLPEPTASYHPTEACAYELEAISLGEMEGVRLMNRTDTKYMLPRSTVPELIAAMRGKYRILEVEGTRLSTYETVYFDTSDLRCYHDHRRGRLNRYKVRQRQYVPSDLRFTEVKHKTNHGRTVKERIPTDGKSTFGHRMDARSRAFVDELTRRALPDLRAVLRVNYRRITLVSRHSAERVTLDLDLTFEAGQHRQKYPALAIAEVKQSTRQPSALMDYLKKRGIRPGSISKYCLGIMSTRRAVRHNRFKPQLLQLKKILNP